MIVVEPRTLGRSGVVSPHIHFRQLIPLLHIQGPTVPREVFFVSVERPRGVDDQNQRPAPYYLNTVQYSSVLTSQAMGCLAESPSRQHHTIASLQ
jgi:hypothetical protein